MNFIRSFVNQNKILELSSSSFFGKIPKLSSPSFLAKYWNYLPKYVYMALISMKQILTLKFEQHSVHNVDNDEVKKLK